MWGKISTFLRHPIDTVRQARQPTKVTFPPEEPSLPLGREVWDRIEELKRDPDVDVKITTALERLHKKLSSGFQDEPLFETFTTGINRDRVKLEIRRNELAELVMKYGYKFYNLEVIISRYDHPEHQYHLPILSGGEKLIMRDILGSTRYTKLMISDAYEYLYTGIRRPTY